MMKSATFTVSPNVDARLIWRNQGIWSDNMAECSCWVPPVFTSKFLSYTSYQSFCIQYSVTLAGSSNNRHTVVCSVRQNLERCAVLGHQCARWAPWSLDGDFRARQFGVEASLLAARRILVAQADEGACRGMDAAGDVDLGFCVSIVHVKKS